MKLKAAFTVVTTLLLMPGAVAAAGETFSSVVSREGEITLPSEFRLTMTHLGSWFIPEGEAGGFHDVYMDRPSVQSYVATGQIPDGAVLIKELRSATTGNYTTGQDVAHATRQIKQWFVMVKDRKGRFAGNPLWGDGWGWALFKPDDPARNVAVDYKTDCLGCHVPARANDWIYKQAYPVLQVTAD